MTLLARYGRLLGVQLRLSALLSLQYRADFISDGHGKLPVVLDERWPLKGYSGVNAASGQAAPEAAGQGDFAPAPSFEAPSRFRRR